MFQDAKLSFHTGKVHKKGTDGRDIKGFCQYKYKHCSLKLQFNIFSTDTFALDEELFLTQQLMGSTLYANICNLV